MSNSTQMDRVLDGMLNFNAETKETLDSIKETIDKVFDKHYQANHTPYAIMKFEDEYHYWEEQLAEAINRVEYSDYDVLEPKGVEMLQRRSYVIIRGELKSGNTIHFDNTKFNQLYINGEYYTGDYTFNGETPETYERLVVVVVQTPFNLGIKDYGNLEMTVADFPIENAEIFANVGTYSNFQPVIEELLEDETVDSFYIKGNWRWKSKNITFIKTLKTLDDFSIETEAIFKAPSLINHISPNVTTVIANKIPHSVRNIDISNAGNIDPSAFSSSRLNGELRLTNRGYIGAYAFSSCEDITDIYLDNGITSISVATFSGCSKLYNIYIGDTVVSLDRLCFAEVPASIVHLGNSITQLDSSAFYKNTGDFIIKNFTVSKGYKCPITSITRWSFSDNIVLETFIEVVKNCANIGENGRTATTMTFKVKSSVRTAITNAYNAGDEKAIELYDLMSAKSISITS